MVWIKAPRDDHSVNTLIRQNRQSNAIGRAKNIQPGAQKSLLQRDKVPIKRQLKKNLRVTNRRLNDRRKQQVSVLLDTRSSNDRRCRQRRKSQGTHEKNHQENLGQHGISKYC